MRRLVRRLRIERQGGGEEGVLPVVTLEAGAPGPVVVLTANVHGDECTGVQALHELDEHLRTELAAGTAVLYPSLNPTGLAARTRGVPADGADLNRMFPAEATGTPSERLAAVIWSDILAQTPDVLVDVHADSAASIPYVLVDRAVGHSGAARARIDRRIGELAEATGLTVLREYPDEQYVRFSLDRSLAGAMVNRLGTPAITIESGPRRVLDPAAVAAAVGAVLGVLRRVGLVNGRGGDHPSRVVSGPWRRAASPRARFDGVFVPLLRPGSGFEAGDVLGRVRSLTGEVLEEVHAPEAGIVISWIDATWVAAGGVLGTLGVEDP